MKNKKDMIFRAAHELFAQKGYKETNIPEITNLAGVGVGTFYNYYASKDEIFFEVFARENEKTKKEMMSSIDPGEDLQVTLTRMMVRSRDAISSNLILREWYNKDLYSRMEKWFQEEKSNERMNEIIQTYLSEFILKWQQEGKIRSDLEVGMILALFNSTVYVDMHKTEVGIQFFPQLIYHLLDFIIKGLTSSPEQPVIPKE
ncbi:MAG: TetR/AcrR family transcriptional regulator [Chloroflexi bacterium HGW-Chloroflexi-10]|nr:MAG: TetR/AcrR family transcriptional regulator [Chloroflexi bacterium HGW-Chloroflexi-10]